MAVVVLAAGFAAVLGGAFLFTNAVEWAGTRLGLGVGAVGTLLAGVATAVPESAIPDLAVLRGDPRADEVAIGAIIGAPFMLATVAMALVGLTALGYARRREQGRALDVHRPTLRRDLLVFLLAFSTAVTLGVGVSRPLAVAGAVAFLVAYGLYARATVRRGGRPQEEHELDPLLADTTKHTGGFAILAGATAIAGGLVAYWSLARRGRFAGAAIAAWSMLFATFAASVVLLG